MRGYSVVESKGVDSEVAAKRLRDHRVSDQAVLNGLLLPTGPASDRLSPNELLAEARRRAGERELGAWDTVGWLEQIGPGFLVDDAAFTAAQQAALHAPVTDQAAWLGQWNRPELWLAALGDDRAPGDYPVLLAAVLGESSLSGEALAALLYRALRSADRVAFEEDRQRQVEGVPLPDGVCWADREWPPLAARLADNLLQLDGPGQAVAIEMLILCDPVPNGPRYPAVAWHWHVALAERLPEAAFGQLLARAGRDDDLYALSALQGAALTAATRLEKQVEWAARVWASYGAMPVTHWHGWGGPLIGEAKRGGQLPGLLGACLVAQPDPVESWYAILQVRYPGAPEGWPADIANWRNCAAATAHLEWVGLCACLDPGFRQTGGPVIRDRPLFEKVRDVLHQRLIEAAGDYQVVDAALLHMLWVIGGDEARQVSWQAIPDRWMAEQQRGFDPQRIRIGPLGGSRRGR